MDDRAPLRRMTALDDEHEMARTTQPLDTGAAEQHLRDRLTTMYSHRGDGIPTQFVNPDGPDAVALLDSYRARVDRAEDVAGLLSAEVSKLRASLSFYAHNHEWPNEGPWGVDSTDFGNVARTALGDPT